MLIAAYRLSHKNALVAPFHYTQIIAGSFIWGDIPTINLWLGVIVIIAAGLYVINHGAKNQEPIEPAP